MPTRSWLVTGGAGFIGANTVRALAERGERAVVLDNLSRATAALNVEWLEEHAALELVRADVRDADAVDRVFDERGPFDVVLHLAGQVAVTASVAAPREDFETNAGGTFNVLDATRRHCPAATFVNASTNKVYGRLAGHRVEERETRYADVDAPDGIAETEPLDPHSPYGCSKCAADVYTLDYARVYGLRATSLRQSCIYGPRQFGVEDQGWVAWFATAVRLGRRLTIFGNGKQVRDLLHVDDLVALYLLVADDPERCAGRAYNVGGGPSNTLSLLELLERLRAWRGGSVDVGFDDARTGDQPVFVANTRRALEDLGWTPRVDLDEGLADLLAFVEEHAERALPLLRGT
jgi:CDP-paratose 2-epimerase